ncbi:uncharacterized protein LOC122371029 isoform X6 [Amphibalanus amphitrite]|uniref:uncharacterized protein LOC122371029 isoform X6 n=1 Tax=Amphibalanus amphitrite TaxID=1232801 RepID=UPI001C905233|nr:uncharacterized protein LOC122371029 isoform X6 [Amphibalanus amphitrite]
MRVGRLLTVAALLTVLLAVLGDAQVYQPPDTWSEFVTHPLLTVIVRVYEFCKNVRGGWKTFLGRRRRSLDSPSVDEAGDPCDLRVPCLALKAMDAGTLDQWVEERWPAAAGKWRSQPQLAKLLERLEQLQREELPHSRQLRRRACQVVLQRCPAS